MRTSAQEVRCLQLYNSFRATIFLLDVASHMATKPAQEGNASICKMRKPSYQGATVESFLSDEVQNGKFSAYLFCDFQLLFLVFVFRC